MLPVVAICVYTGADKVPVTAYKLIVITPDGSPLSLPRLPDARTSSCCPSYTFCAGRNNAPTALVEDGVDGATPILGPNGRGKYFTAVPVPPTFDGN